MNKHSVSCALCGNDAQLKYSGHSGYQSSKKYDIYHCSACFTAFVDPLEVDMQIYDLIYSQIDKVPGYDRYHHYARQVLREKDPLDYLAQEDIYWSIQAFLNSQRKPHLKILEVGCGFGYLTYALAKAGYDVRGIDISQVAVDQATKRYGPLFQCEDIYDFAKRMGPSYDVVIFTEVIEHIPDVRGFLKAAGDLLLPGGSLVMTTPNRTPYPEDILWETEPPPVHLWWFSEKSMASLADQLGYNLSFVDFNPFSLGEIARSGDYLKPYIAIRNFQPSRLPRLGANGDVLNQESTIAPPAPDPDGKSWRKRFKMVLRRIGLLGALQNTKQAYLLWKKARGIARMKRLLKKNPQSRLTLCAIFRKF